MEESVAKVMHRGANDPNEYPTVLKTDVNF